MDFSSVSNTIIDVTFWTLVIGLVGGSLYFIFWWLSFKNSLEIREVVNNRKIIKNYRWKEKKDRQGNTWLLTPKLWVIIRGLKLPIPPNDAVEITSKGKKKVVAWSYDNNNVWAVDNFNFQQYRESKGSEFQPLDTTDRELLVDELVKSKEYEGRTVWEKVLMISLILAPILLVLVIGLTLGDITDSLSSYASKITSISEGDGLNVKCEYSQSFQNVGTETSAQPKSTPPG